jgi:predicted nucleotidyltransferase
MKKEVYNKLRNYLQDRQEIDFAYVFGSFTKSDHYHDIDIAIYLVENFNPDNYKKFPYGYESNLIADISALLKTDKIDLVIFNKAGILIQQRIINSGMLLFESNRYKRIGYENYVRGLYNDAESLRKIKMFYLKRYLNNA